MLNLIRRSVRGLIACNIKIFYENSLALAQCLNFHAKFELTDPRVFYY